MKFFTREWREGEAEADAASAYEAHLEALGSRISAEARALAEVNLHDGLLRRVEMKAGDLLLIVRAGDLQLGYQDVLIWYSAAEVVPSVDALRTAKSEILDHELDVASGRLEHRFQLDSGAVVSIRCADVDWGARPTDGRAF